MIENVSLARDHRLRKHASALVEAGMRVTVICRRDPGNACVPGVRVLDYPAPAEGSGVLGFLWEYLYSLLMAALLTLRTWFTAGIDVVQVSSTPDIYFVITTPLRWLRRRVVFDFKDLSPEIYEARYGRRTGAMYRLLRLCERVSLVHADHVLAVNASVRRVAQERGGIPETAVTIVGNGPRLADTAPRPPRPELRRGHRYLCCLIGMMGPQDRIDLAVEAVAYLVRALGRTDCAFTFVGVGDAVPAAQRLVERHDLGAWVSFPGWAERDEVFDYLSTADLGIESNTEEFVSPVKAMEYMAFGLPMVAFDAAETRALAGDSATLVPREDVAAFARAIDDLLRDPDRRARMGRAGRAAVVQRVAWDHQKKPYVAVFEQLMVSRGRMAWR